MKWVVAYFEQEDTTQPAEVFEDALDSTLSEAFRQVASSGS